MMTLDLVSFALAAAAQTTNQTPLELTSGGSSDTLVKFISALLTVLLGFAILVKTQFSKPTQSAQADTAAPIAPTELHFGGPLVEALALLKQLVTTIQVAIPTIAMIQAFKEGVNTDVSKRNNDIFNRITEVKRDLEIQIRNLLDEVHELEVEVARLQEAAKHSHRGH